MSFRLLIDLRGETQTVVVLKRRGKTKLLPVASHRLPAKGDTEGKKSLEAFFIEHGAPKGVDSS